MYFVLLTIMLTAPTQNLKRICSATPNGCAQHGDNVCKTPD